MLAPVGLLYLYFFFQVGVAAVLLHVREPNALARRILATLFLLNAGVTAIALLEAAGYAGYETYRSLFLLRYALDVPTAALLVAFLAARNGTERGARVAYALLGVGALHAVAAVAFPSIALAENQSDVWLRAIPYYAALGAFGWILSVGSERERWIALAFLPRALYFGASGLHRLEPALAGEVLAWELPNAVALLGLLLASLAAGARLLRDPRAPGVSVALPVLALGPVLAAAEIAITGKPVGLLMAVNLVTLALVRPILVCAGLARDKVPALLARALAAAGGASVALWFLLVQGGVPHGADLGLGLAAGLLVLAALEAWRPGLASHDAGTLPGPPAAAAAPAPAPSSPPILVGASTPLIGVNPPTPAWKVLILALRHSSAGQDRPGEPRLTQKRLAEQTGVSVKRVSEFAQQLNESAVQKLDLYVPGWKAQAGLAPPVLVRTHKGAVEGLPGAWVYYRLTPLGEKLAESVARTDRLTPVRTDEDPQTQNRRN
ncbi:MAG TPA: hypothetical protein VM681_04665 [Candidatus Thermoplasmatota archaeon]|nr:hypothetical protein [Candidatus Thermoplasmatota archaeon]